MKKWTDIVIRPADQGSKFMVLDRDDYINRVLEHVQDESTFMRISDKQQAIEKVINDIKNWIVKYNEEQGMTPNMIDFLTPDEKCKPGNNYVNPKAHRSSQNYPGRYISTGWASFTKISLPSSITILPHRH